jgi:hypothetical protein
MTPAIPIADVAASYISDQDPDCNPDEGEIDTAMTVILICSRVSLRIMFRLFTK